MDQLPRYGRRWWTFKLHRLINHFYLWVCDLICWCKVNVHLLVDLMNLCVSLVTLCVTWPYLVTWPGRALAHRTRKTERTRTNYVPNQSTAGFQANTVMRLHICTMFLNGICIFVCDCYVYNLGLFGLLIVCSFVCLVFTVFPTINEKSWTSVWSVESCLLVKTSG